MGEPVKKLSGPELLKKRKEMEQRELAKCKIPTVDSLLNSVAFMKSFSSKMNSQVLKTDTLHIMHTRCMMEILDQLKQMNKNLETLLDAQEGQEDEQEDQDQPRTSKKLSRDK